MELNREKAIDILDKFDFFQGQRAGRELWQIKSFEAQEQDIADFSRDVALLKCYINELTEENESLEAEKEHLDIVVEGKLKRIQSLERMVLKLTEENERLNSLNKVLTKNNSDLETELAQTYDLLEGEGTLCTTYEEVAKAKADTLKDVQMRFAMHFGTYTGDAEVKVSEVFKLLSKFAEEMLEGEI